MPTERIAMRQVREMLRLRLGAVAVGKGERPRACAADRGLRLKKSSSRQALPLEVEMRNVFSCAGRPLPSAQQIGYEPFEISYLSRSSGASPSSA
jgi:hypothetical protein